MKVELYSESGNKTVTFDVKQIFENGYGVSIDFNSTIFDGIDNPKILIIIQSNDEKYMNRKVEVGYEIIDKKENEIREINIMEHIWGMTKNSETCYKIKEEDKAKMNKAIMLINIFSQSIEFNIKDSNNAKIYSLDVFNNYFIRFPNISGDYFCFKHTTPKEKENEIYGEVSYDFQIYYEDKLYKYQMFIMPLINGKIYTYSLNRGDIIVYRHNYYENYTENNELKIYSANMLKIRGNPKLYGISCKSYPNNCNVNNNKLKNSQTDEIYPLNLYNINKRLNAEGNIEINNNGEALYEQRNQYLTIVSCESEETDPNQGECKYTIEINNERDEVQLIPETVFATIIMNPINYFLIRVSDYKSIKYLKIYFTVLIGNAEMFIYEDSQYQNEITSYNFRHVHRKEIIEISENLKENYYLIIKCQDKAFIQLKYVTNLNYKGYNNLIPNEINIEPINHDINSYYNMYYPNYYFPFENETRNNNFFYKIMTMDCLMTLSDVSQSHSNLAEYNFEIEKNKLYYYLSSYGFYSKVDSFLHTSFDKENCGLIIYNGEKSDNRPLFIMSGIPLESKFNTDFYIYPIIYEKNNDKNILVEIRLHDADDMPNREIVYRIGFYTYYKSRTNSHIESINKNDKNYYSYLIKEDLYPSSLLNNVFALLYIKLVKIYPDKKYYYTINIMSTNTSIEYISSNQTSHLTIRGHCSRYFYSQINKNNTGYIKFNYPSKSYKDSVLIYAKIVKKDEIEKDYNWNKRVKLPEEADENLLEMDLEKSLIEYNENYTEKCDNGCEIYFQIKNPSSVYTTIDFTFHDGEYKEPSDEKTDKASNEDETSYLWVAIVVPILVVVIVGVIIVIVYIMRKRKNQADINKIYKDVTVPLSDQTRAEG